MTNDTHLRCRKACTPTRNNAILSLAPLPDLLLASENETQTEQARLDLVEGTFRHTTTCYNR